jgi:TolB-like protein
MSLFEELKRRNVFRVAVAYLVTAWVLLQIADLVLQNIHAPDWVIQAFMLALGLGFPVAVIFAWAFELTPEGLKKEKDVDRTQSITSRTGRKLDLAIIGVLTVAVVFLLIDRFSPESGEDSATNVSESIGNAATQTNNAIPANATSSRTPIRDGTSVTAPEHQAKSIAVLPFTVMSTGPDDEYFADGLTEEIINALSQLPELMVTARTSAFHFKGQNVPIGDIAAQLGVANVVEGSVRRAGDQLRITAQLIRAEDGFHLWSESYDRRTEDTFAVQQDIAEKVATALNVLLDENQRQRMQQAGLKNVEAFIAYQKGMELFTRAHMEGVDFSLLRQSNQMLELVSAAAPGFGRAYIQHSDLFTHILIAQASGQLDGNITEADIETAPAALSNDYDQAVRHARNEGERLIAEADRALLLGEWRGLNSLSERALQVPGCEAALWAQFTSAPFGHAKTMQDAFARMAVCNPLDIRPRCTSPGRVAAEPQRARRCRAGFGAGRPPHAGLSLFMALAAQGDFGCGPCDHQPPPIHR